MLAAPHSSPWTTKLGPIASVLVFLVLDTCSVVRALNIIVELDDRPRSVLAECLVDDVTLGEVTLNLL